MNPDDTTAANDGEVQLRPTTSAPVHDWDILSVRAQREMAAYAEVIGVFVAFFVVRWWWRRSGLSGVEKKSVSRTADGAKQSVELEVESTSMGEQRS